MAGGAIRRYEYGFESGDTITSYYDPMIAKVIVWDETRPRAIQKMIRTLKDSIVFGVHTNIPYLIEILNHQDFQSGTMTTRFIENNFSEGLPAQSETKAWPQELYKAYLAGTGNRQGNATSLNNQDIKSQSPWQSNWRAI